MKKVLIILMIIACLFIFTSCGYRATEDSNIGGYFIKIIEYDCDSTIFMYDPFTKIVYFNIYHGISPYYIMKFGEPVMAIYGVNWTEADLPERIK